MLSRGNLDKDPDAIIDLVKAGINAELPNVLDLITKRGNNFQYFYLITECCKAGAKYADIKSSFEFVTRNNYSAAAFEFMCALFKASVASEVRANIIQTIDSNESPK